MRRLRKDDPILLSRGARGPTGGRVPPAKRLQSKDQLPSGTGAAVRSRGIGETAYWARQGPVTTLVERPALLHLDLTDAGPIMPTWGPGPIPEPGAR